jgi:SNF2 family DNA or RNA helicase
LGKTVQLSLHFGALADLYYREYMDINSHTIERYLHTQGSNVESVTAGMFLVVCPATLLFHWLGEMHRWSPCLRVVIFHEVSTFSSKLMKKSNKGTYFNLAYFKYCLFIEKHF